jgi:hypothetical protein
MKLLIAAMFVALPLISNTVFAADTPAPKQQSKMAACSKANKGLKGDEFKNAQKECLSKDSAPAKSAEKTDKPASQKNKMAACSKENKGLKGDEYKQAQKACLGK